MPIVKYRPNHTGRRDASALSSADLTRQVTPPKALLAPWRQRAGRNSQGRITVRHRGGGAKRHYRLVDFHQDKYDVPGRVAAVHYDPQRNSRLALVKYRDGEWRYHLAAAGAAVGQTVLTARHPLDIQNGFRLPLAHIPTGLNVHNVELAPGRGGQMARSAGSSVTLQAIEGTRALLRLPSGEVRAVAADCLATVGEVGNADFRNVRWGKAGRTRHRGIRPSVRGKVMNPVDHPHGGGEGKQPIGLKHPKTPWGKPALGVKTRRSHKRSAGTILQRRSKR